MTAALYATLRISGVVFMLRTIYIPRNDFTSEIQDVSIPSGSVHPGSRSCSAKSAEISPAKPLVSKKAKDSRKWISRYTDYEPCSDSKLKHDSIEDALDCSEEDLKRKIRKIYDFDKGTPVSLYNDSRWTYERDPFPEKSSSPNRYNLILQTDTNYRAS